MANISSASDICYQCETPETAKILFDFFEAIESDDRYTMVEEPELRGVYVTSDYAIGRWVYSKNFECCFETPETWLGWELTPNEKEKAAFDKLVERLKDTGESITVDWDDEEAGNDIFEHCRGVIEYVETTKKLSANYTVEDDDAARQQYLSDEEEREEN